MKYLFLFIILFINLGSSDLKTIADLMRNSKQFQDDEVKIERKVLDNFLIYSTKNSEKKPLIVYSEVNFEKFQFTELEKVLLFCHELGHFKAGAPYKTRGRSQKLSWSSAEGQADYYSTAFCLKDFSITELSFKEVDDIDISNQIYHLCPDFECIKVLSSIYNVIRIYQSFTNSHEKLSFIDSNHSVPTSTILDYPSNQCRLNTLRNGYFCQEIDAIENDCFIKDFARPTCWFIK
jgi:hypothetical protein